MEELKKWMETQMTEGSVEPNSGLGKAIRYCLKHWDLLTRFLRDEGAPLDNNVCERGIKTPILHRKNSLFYLTPNGSRVGDLFMSLIQTCRLNGIDPFHYVTELLRRIPKGVGCAQDWLPWRYQATLARLDGGGEELTASRAA